MGATAGVVWTRGRTSLRTNPSPNFPSVSARDRRGRAPAIRPELSLGRWALRRFKNRGDRRFRFTPTEGPARCGDNLPPGPGFAPGRAAFCPSERVSSPDASPQLPPFPAPRQPENRGADVEPRPAPQTVHPQVGTAGSPPRRAASRWVCLSSGECRGRGAFSRFGAIAPSGARGPGSRRRLCRRSRGHGCPSRSRGFPVAIAAARAGPEGEAGPDALLSPQ